MRPNVLCLFWAAAATVPITIYTRTSTVFLVFIAYLLGAAFVWLDFQLGYQLANWTFNDSLHTLLGSAWSCCAVLWYWFDWPGVGKQYGTAALISTFMFVYLFTCVFLKRFETNERGTGVGAGGTGWTRGTRGTGGANSMYRQPALETRDFKESEK